MLRTPAQPYLYHGRRSEKATRSRVHSAIAVVNIRSRYHRDRFHSPAQTHLTQKRKSRRPERALDGDMIHFPFDGRENAIACDNLCVE